MPETKRKPRNAPAPAKYDPDAADHYVRETIRLSLAALFEELSGDLDNAAWYESDGGLEELRSTLATYAEVIRRTQG